MLDGLQGLAEDRLIPLDAVTVRRHRRARSTSGVRLGSGRWRAEVGAYVGTLGGDVRFVEKDPRRADFARELGFETAAAVPALSVAGGGRPIVFECTGRAEVVEAALDLVPAPREIVLVGTFEGTAGIGPQRLARYETRVVGSQMYTREDVVRAVDALASPGGAGYARLVSAHDYPLEDVGQAFEAAAGAGDGVKVQVVIGG